MGATTYLVPPVTIALAWVLLGETPVALAFVGGALCLAGVALSRRTGRRSSR
jgi:drug/metabolite transporter (DMT)-like permease